ncbi:EAAT5 variant-like [Scleropages formosus]|uniref:Amino acid transporter n=1 Tax=Scleropages formosus TaxID=113540 RepID=A0A0P7V3I2_SCLFO|nr:EAAT5 variant-like [Scleropages formosus]
MALALDSTWVRVKNVCKQNGLLILSVLAVVIGCLLGFFLRAKHLSEQVSLPVDPSHVLLHLNTSFISTVLGSLMSGLAALDAKCSSRLGIMTISYYLWTTFVAVVVGIIMVIIIHPGGAAQKEDSEDSGKPIMSSADALLDLIRNMFPANLVQATFQQYRTRSIPILKSPKPTISQDPTETATRRVFVYGIQDDNGTDIQNFSLDLTPPPDVIFRTLPGTSEGMNVLGIVIFSATMGMDHHNSLITSIMLGRMGPNGSALVNFCQSLNEAVLKIVAIVIWSCWFLCFCSSATLPITFKCLLENNHIDRRIIRFVLPVGATINMDGTALYEAVAAIFIAQVNNYELDFGQIITISITATAASIGAAGIPQAGLVTMVIVLTSVGLPTDDITLIIAVDWALDRFRTMVNVMGDALATGIMAHICRKDFVKEGEEVPLICETKPLISIQQMMTYQKNGRFQPPPGVKPDHIPPEVARLIQLEEGVRPAEKKKSPSHKRVDRDHCSIDMNGLETNV